MSTARVSAGIEGHLTAIVRVEPASEARCAVAETTESDAVNQNLIERAGGTECRADVECQDGSSSFVETTTGEGCICPALRTHDCVSSIESVERGEIVLSLSIPDRDELAGIIETLRETGATVRLQRITAPNGERTNNCYEFEIDSITEKQREAVVAAIKAGYYDTPREADLADLAEELGISRSAVSQRLTAVEAKLVTELCRAEDGMGCCE